jgi:hypothetical protein
MALGAVVFNEAQVFPTITLTTDPVNLPYASSAVR